MSEDTRTPLSQYTIEELKAELIKRRKKSIVRTTKYLEWEGEVIRVHEWGKVSQFHYTVRTEDPRIPDIEKEGKFFVSPKMRKTCHPKLGDRVVLKLRYTKRMESGKVPIWWSFGKIQRVISSP